MARITNKQLKEENEQLRQKLSEEKTQKEGLINNHKQELENLNLKHAEELDKLKNDYKIKSEELERSISDLEKQNKDKQKQLDKRELKKLAEAYKEQEDEYKTDRDRWFVHVAFSFILLTVSIAISAYFASGGVWYEKIGYYLTNFVFLTFLIFALKQYSYYNKLRTDYANRKTLAQSYHNIINQEENTDIKSKFIDKASSVLAAKSEVDVEANTIPEKLLESITEIAKALSKKI